MASNPRLPTANPMGARVTIDARTRRAWAKGLRAMRIARGLTQSDVAARVGCTRSAVSAWERGIAIPPLETRQRIARALRVSYVRAFPIAA